MQFIKFWDIYNMKNVQNGPLHSETYQVSIWTEFKRNSRELIFYTPSCGCLGVHISISLAVENTDLTNMYPV